MVSYLYMLYFDFVQIGLGADIYLLYKELNFLGPSLFEIESNILWTNYFTIIYRAQSLSWRMIQTSFLHRQRAEMLE